MTATTLDLYEALIAAGVDSDKAKAAAASVMSSTRGDDFVSKDRLDAERNAIIAELRATRASILQWVATMLVGQAGVIVALQQML